MNDITIDARDAIRQLDNLRKRLTEREVNNATRMAMNDATRWGRTRVKDAIRAQYNIQSTRIMDKDPKKGLSVQLATNNNLTAKIRAGHIPVNLASFTGTRVTKNQGTFVEIRKGQRKRINTAFGLKVTKGVQGASGMGQKPVVFARGRNAKPSFIFGKPRMPISALSSLSVATAAMNTNAIKEYEPKVSERFQQQLVRQLNRLIDKGIR